MRLDYCVKHSCWENPAKEKLHEDMGISRFLKRARKPVGANLQVWKRDA